MWRVILADDEAYVRTGLMALIPWQKHGCEVVGQAENARELFLLANGPGADIIILDIRMPGMDGLAAAEALLARHPELIIIFLTGYEDFSFARAAVNLGAAAYIVKTDVLEELPAALDKACKTLAKSRVEEEPPVRVALLRALCDGTFLMRRGEDALSRAYEALARDFGARRLLAVELTPGADAMEIENIKLLLESGFQRFSPALFPMLDTRLCLLLNCEDALPDEIFSQCEALLPVAEGFCALKVVFAVSARFSSPVDIRAAYAGVDGLLKRRLRDDGRGILFEKAEEEARGTDEGMNDLFHLLENGGAEAFGAWLDGFARLLRDRDLICARGECLRALSDMERICNRYDKRLSPPGGRDFRADVITCETVKGLREILEMAMRETTRLIRRENEKIHALVKAANDYIRAHSCEKVSLADIANAVHANPSHLSRFYKEKTGKNLFDVLNDLRVESAVRMMKTTCLKTYEIADAVGFSDTSNFSKFFKKHTGMSPRDFQRGMGGDGK